MRLVEFEAVDTVPHLNDLGHLFSRPVTSYSIATLIGITGRPSSRMDSWQKGGPKESFPDVAGTVKHPEVMAKKEIFMSDDEICRMKCVLFAGLGSLQLPFPLTYEL